MRLASLLVLAAVLSWPIDAATGTAQKEPYPMGQLYSGDSYPVKLEAVNPCNLARVVNIKYPTTFKLAGPNSVTVPPHSVQPVPMLLVLPAVGAESKPGVPQTCKDLKGDVVFEHEQFERVDRVAGGTNIYRCNASVRTIEITMHVHAHPPPEPPGGGGGKKKNPANICRILFNHGEFFPAPGVVNPDQCHNEILQAATEYYDELEPIRKIDPNLFEWLPKRTDLEKLGVSELLQMKEKADLMAVKVKK